MNDTSLIDEIEEIIAITNETVLNVTQPPTYLSMDPIFNHVIVIIFFIFIIVFLCVCSLKTLPTETRPNQNTVDDQMGITLDTLAPTNIGIVTLPNNNGNQTQSRHINGKNKTRRERHDSQPDIFSISYNKNDAENAYSQL